MADTVYTRLLARAIEIEGSTQGLAHRLRVPEATLLRWMRGRAQLPWKVYGVLVDFIRRAETRAGQPPTDANSVTPTARASAGRLTFPLGGFNGRCATCDGIEFRQVDANAELTMTSVLECCACHAQTMHGDLLVQFGEEIARRSKANALSRTRRPAVTPSRPAATPNGQKNNREEPT